MNFSDVWEGKISSQSLSRIPTNMNKLISEAKKSQLYYVDTHCNIFTDIHFYDVINELIKARLLGFQKASVYQVKPGFLDFLCILWKQENKILDIDRVFPDFNSGLIKDDN